MKKFFLVTLTMILLMPSLVFADSIISPRESRNCYIEYQLWANKTKATADNKDSIKLYVKRGYSAGSTGCIGGGPVEDYVKLSLTGGGALTKTTLNRTTPDGQDAATYETAYLKSTTPGTKTFTMTPGIAGFGDNPESIAGGSVTFTAPPTPTKTTTPTTTTPTTTKTTEKEETKEKPATPVLAKLRVGETELTGEQLRAENQFSYQEGATFSGTTIPNGKVHLYFNSDPYEAVVTADKDGNWEYTLDKDLGEGDHTLEVAVEDPETKEISEKSEPYSFTLVAGATTEAEVIDLTPIEEESTYPAYFWYLIAGAVIVVVGSGVGGVLYYKKKRSNGKNPKTEPSE